MVTLELSAGAICDFVETYTGVTTANDALKYVKAGYARFLAGLDPRTGRTHTWSFLQPYSTIDLWTTQTGTASGAPVYSDPSSTITSASAMFYESMVGHDVAFTGGSSYTITSYTSSTVVVVTGDASGEADGRAMTVTATGYYSFESDFGGLIENPVYPYSSTLTTLELEEVTPETIYTYWRNTDTAGVPRYWAIIPQTFVAATGQRYQVICAPLPEDARTWSYRYLVSALDITDVAEVFLLGGTTHSYTIRQFALADAEMILGHTSGVQEDLAQKMMAAAIDIDKALFTSTEVECIKGGP